MNIITLRHRWITTYRNMRTAVEPPQRSLHLSKPALWRRLLAFGWTVYRATSHRRVRSTPGMTFDAIVVGLFLALGAVNLLI